MGYPMAKNLRAGLGKDKTLLICDVSEDLLNRFIQETQGQGPVEIVSNGFEAAKAAVSSRPYAPNTRGVKADPGVFPSRTQ